MFNIGLDSFAKRRLCRIELPFNCTARPCGDRHARAGMFDRVNTLGNALQTIGDNAKLPIEVYGADGKQIQSYRSQG